MIGINAIDHINFSVNQLPRSIDFYQHVFGFEVKEDHRDNQTEPYVIMGLPYIAYLAIYEDPLARRPRHNWLNHWGFQVADLDQTSNWLYENQIPRLYANRRQDGIFIWSHSRSIYIQDPDKHHIELVENFGGGLH